MILKQYWARLLSVNSMNHLMKQTYTIIQLTIIARTHWKTQCWFKTMHLNSTMSPWLTTDRVFTKATQLIKPILHLTCPLRYLPRTVALPSTCHCNFRKKYWLLQVNKSCRCWAFRNTRIFKSEISVNSWAKYV